MSQVVDIALLDGHYYESIDDGAIQVKRQFTLRSFSENKQNVVISQISNNTRLCDDSEFARISSVQYFKQCSLFYFDIDSDKPLAIQFQASDVTLRGLYNFVFAVSNQYRQQEVIPFDIKLNNVVVTGSMASFMVISAINLDWLNKPAQKYDQLGSVKFDSVKFTNVSISQQFSVFENLKQSSMVMVSGIGSSLSNVVVEDSRCRSSVAEQPCAFFLFDGSKLAANLVSFRNSIADVLIGTQKAVPMNYVEGVSDMSLQKVNVSGCSFASAIRYTMDGTLFIEGEFSANQNTYDMPRSVAVYVQAARVASVHLKGIENSIHQFIYIDGARKAIINANIDATGDKHLHIDTCVQTSRNMEVSFAGTFKGCRGGNGGTLSSRADGSLKLWQVSITSSSARQLGGAIYVQGTNSVELRDVELIGNRAQQHGGAMTVVGDAQSPTRLIWTDKVICTSNTAQSNGGCLYASDTIWITGQGFGNASVLMQTNQASKGGCVALVKPQISDTLARPYVNCSNNQASITGGMIFMDNNMDIGFWRLISQGTGNSLPDASSIAVKFTFVNVTLPMQTPSVANVYPGQRFSASFKLSDVFDATVTSEPTIASLYIGGWTRDRGPVTEGTWQSTIASSTNDIVPSIENIAVIRFPPHSLVNMIVSVPRRESDFMNPSVRPATIMLVVQDCPAGMELLEKDQLYTCEMCVPGTYSPHMNSSCIVCPRGTWQSDRGATRCEACPWWIIGSLTDTGLSDAAQCSKYTLVIISIGAAAVIFVVFSLIVTVVLIRLLLRARRKDALVRQLLASGDGKYLQLDEHGDLEDTQKSSLDLKIPNRLLIRSEDVKILSLIASGSQASLFSAVYHSTPIALKFYAKNTFSGDALSLQEFQNELLTLDRHGAHKNILRLLGVVQYPKKIALATDLLETSLGSVLTKAEMVKADSSSSVSWASFWHWEVKKRILHGIALGMAHLHAGHVMHRDLKPDNILINESEWNPVLCDFGWSKRLYAAKKKANSSQTLGVGTAAFLCPEFMGISTENDESMSYENQDTPMAGDVYSFGIVMCCLLLEKNQPYGDLSDVDILFRVKGKAERPLVEDQQIYVACKKSCQEHGYSHARLNEAILQVAKVLALMRRCWAQDPIARPSFQEIVDEFNTMKS